VTAPPDPATMLRQYHARAARERHITSWAAIIAAVFAAAACGCALTAFFLTHR